ncbi:hypothetical protein TNCV_4514031 [Trichonephila clavipes]|nr:hypothetical protein TNCV_4514031 [Trichonephila clavipes]
MWNPQKAGYLLRNILGSKVVKTNLKGLPYQLFCYQLFGGCGSPVVKVSDHVRRVRSSSPVPPNTRRVGQRCTLNLR